MEDYLANPFTRETYWVISDPETSSMMGMEGPEGPDGPPLVVFFEVEEEAQKIRREEGGPGDVVESMEGEDASDLACKISVQGMKPAIRLESGETLVLTYMGSYKPLEGEA